MSDVMFLMLRRLRGPLIILILVYALAVIGLVLIPGVDDQGEPWRMSFFHAFYFVSFMGSTIGFGEIPYAFTDAQRFWVLGSIYFSVFAWLYAIGRSLALLQDPAFRHAITHAGFRHAVSKLREPFYLVCGYGDTGRILTRGLSQRGIRAVVIDRDQERINRADLDDLTLYVPNLRADVSDPDTLISGGLRNIHCQGVIAVTNNDRVNLKVAISSKLLNSDSIVICRSELHDVGINMESFGTDHILNPFDMFAERLAMAVHSPARYIIRDWLTSPMDSELEEPLFPPKGRWVLCGYGRFGKAVQQFLSYEGIESTIIEADPDGTDAPPDTIRGRGTEADTLTEAGIKTAAGIIAGTDDDANNLSIIMTARDLNDGLFTVARQNRQENQAIFEAARLDIVMQRSDLIAREIITRVTNPLLATFLSMMAGERDEESCNVLASRISGLTASGVPRVWTLAITKADASAVAITLFHGGRVSLEELLLDSRHQERHDCLPLLLQREKSPRLLPPLDTPLELGDRILLCGAPAAAHRINWTANHQESLGFALAAKQTA
ncbi:MAG: NAD-binding protein [Gammaproteobacteria bacterium]|nr:NAD-binding protein [Gammaproteobacteria bacterium]